MNYNSSASEMTVPHQAAVKKDVMFNCFRKKNKPFVVPQLSEHELLTIVAEIREKEAENQTGESRREFWKQVEKLHAGEKLPEPEPLPPEARDVLRQVNDFRKRFNI